MLEIGQQTDIFKTMNFIKNARNSNRMMKEVELGNKNNHMKMTLLSPIFHNCGFSLSEPALRHL